MDVESQTINGDEEAFIKEEIRDYVESQAEREEAAHKLESFLQKLSGLRIEGVRLNSEFVGKPARSFPVRTLRKGTWGVSVCAGGSDQRIFVADVTTNLNVCITTDYAFRAVENVREGSRMHHLLDHYGFEVSQEGDREWFESTMAIHQAQEVLTKLLVAMAGEGNASNFAKNALDE